MEELGRFEQEVRTEKADWIVSTRVSVVSSAWHLVTNISKSVLQFVLCGYSCGWAEWATSSSGSFPRV